MFLDVTYYGELYCLDLSVLTSPRNYVDNLWSSLQFKFKNLLNLNLAKLDLKINSEHSNEHERQTGSLFQKSIYPRPQAEKFME